MARYEPDEEYSGSGRWGMASYRALHWLMRRRLRASFNDPRSEHQIYHVYRMFGVDMTKG